MLTAFALIKRNRPSPFLQAKALKGSDGGGARAEYLHYKDSVRRLKYMTAAVADKLADLQTHLPECPFSCVQTGK